MAAQKSIMSFFAKGGGKKEAKKEVATVVKAEDDSDELKPSKEITEETKENSKPIENAGSVVTQPILDANGLPPLRKTAKNPAFKKAIKEEGKEEVEKESKKPKDGTKKTKEGKKLKEELDNEQEVSKENKSSIESPIKPSKRKRKAMIESDDEMPMVSTQVNISDKCEESPIKAKKKRKAVIDSDSEEEAKYEAVDVKVVEAKPSPEDSEAVSKMDTSEPETEEQNTTPPKKGNKPDETEEQNTTSEENDESNRMSDDEKESSPVASPEKAKKPISSFFTPKAAIEKKGKKSTPKSSSEKKDKKPDTESQSETKPDPEAATEKNERSPEMKCDTPKAVSKPKAAFSSFFSPKPGAAKRNEGGNDYDKKVQASSYHPVEASFWSQGEPTPYLALAKTLEAVEATSGRLRTIEILSNYLRSVMVQSPEDLLASLYLTLNRLAPAWHGIELGIGESILQKAIANTTGRSAAQIKTDAGRLGDLGLVAEQSRGGQRTMFQPAILTVRGVFSKLQDIASLTGHSSSTKKVEKIQALLVASRGPESRYLIRSLAGKLRIGLAEQSVLQALAQACVQTPLGQEYPPAQHTVYKSVEADKFKEVLGRDSLKLKTAYCECPSYDILVPALLEAGIDGLADRCKLTPGIPLKPMLAHPTKGVQEVLTRFENCSFTCEWKYDGERAQVHLHEDGKVNIYSRNQEDNTTKFPDIISRLPKCLGKEVKSAVLDCEAVAWDREKKSIQPFQVLSTRKRKDAVEDDIKVQVCLFAFDLLYLNGEPLVTRPFQERRDLLKENFASVEGEFQYAQYVDGNTTEEIQEALELSIKDNCEGLMVKTLDVDATYEIARRSHNWLKLKKDYLDGVGDTLDLVVMGGYLGKGKRAGGYGGFLLACYDPENEEYQSICKIGTGFTDEDLASHSAFFKDHLLEKPKSYYSHDPSLAPDQWFEPVQVWEVKCADLSISPVHRAATGIVDPAKGVSLRFPRFIRVREDKKVEDATNAEQIASMYNNQDVIKNQSKEKKEKSADDDFNF